LLTPLEIQNKEFKRSLRGYSELEVDEFLDDVVRDFEALIRENAALKDQVARMDDRLEQYTRIEETLKRALISAEEAAGDMRAAAQREAELITREAHEHARRQIEVAEKECAVAHEMMTKARHEYVAFLARVKAELRAQLDTVSQLLSSRGEPEPDLKGEQA